MDWVQIGHAQTGAINYSDFLPLAPGIKFGD